MKKELKNILVPVDFDAPSLNALKYAYHFAKNLNGELILLSVIETPGLLADFFSSGDSLVKLTNQYKEKLYESSEPYQKKGDVKISTRVERGKSYRKILEVADESNARLIILGENHQKDSPDQELGSTVYHITLKSPIPVLTLKGDAESMKDKIVVPLDLTRQTRKQLFSAMVYGLNYDAEIYLVSALVGGIKMKDSRIHNKLVKAKQLLQENGVKTHVKLFERSETPPFRRVIEYADEISAGMILLMTHQEGYTYDNYIGAFAHHIINKSKVPVLSLTSSATREDFEKMFKGFVDPVGMLTK